MTEEPAAQMPAAAAADAQSSRPVLPPQIIQCFLPATRSVPDTRMVYHAMLLGAASIYFATSKLAAETTEHVILVAPIDDEPVAIDWSEAGRLQASLDDLAETPIPQAVFTAIPSPATDQKKYKRWSSDLQKWLYANHRIELMRSRSLDLISRPGESERDFRVRLIEAAHEARDQQAQQLRDDFAKKVMKLDERVQRAEQAVAREQSQVQQQNVQTAISLGATLLDAFLGRKLVRTGTIGRVTTTARSASRVMKERADAQRALENVERLRSQRQDLEREFEEELQKLETSVDPRTEPLEAVALKPRKSDVTVRLVALAWAPYSVDPQGNRKQLWS